MAGGTVERMDCGNNTSRIVCFWKTENLVLEDRKIIWNSQNSITRKLGTIAHLVVHSDAGNCSFWHKHDSISFKVKDLIETHTTEARGHDSYILIQRQFFHPVQNTLFFCRAPIYLFIFFGDS